MNTELTNFNLETREERSELSEAHE